MRPVRRLFSGLVIALLVPATALAQDSKPGLAVGRLQAIDGRTWTGPVSVGTDGTVRIAGEPPAELPLDAVLSFEADTAAATPSPAPHRVWLRSGLELPAVALTLQPATGGQPAKLVVQLPVGAVIALPLGALAAFRQAGADLPEPASFAADRQDPPANHDLLHVIKDQKPVRSSVTITGCSEGAIDFELRGKEYDFPFAGVAAVVFGKNTGFAADRQGRPRAALRLATGERLEGRLLALGERLQLRLDEEVVVEAPAAAVARFDIASERLRWLGELQPTVEQVPAFDRIWPWLIDRTPAGPGLQLGGKTFSRGLCLVPRTRLTYDLTPGFEWFEATVGIDDRAGPQAHADFRVLADGQELFALRGRTRGMPPETVRVPLRGKQTLVLEVDFGKNYDLGDYCVFADARVVR